MLSRFSCVWLFATPWTVALQAPRPWTSPGKNTGVGCCFLLQGIFPAQRSNPWVLAGSFFFTSATWETLCSVEKFILQYQKWDGPWQHSTRWNKSDRERQILTVSFIYGIWKKKSHRPKKVTHRKRDKTCDYQRQSVGWGATERTKSKGKNLLLWDK